MVEEMHVTESLAAFALGCLEADEQAVVSAHLSACPVCREELLAYSAVLEQIGRSVPQAEPPPALKQSILARIQRSEEKQVEVAGPSWWDRFRMKVLASPTWAAAGLVLVLVLGFSNLLLWQQVRELRTAAPAGQEQLQTVVLQGSAMAPSATGLIVISLDGEHGTLVVDRLPALDEAHEYQLWLIDADEQRTSGAVFSVSQDGYGSVWVKSPQPLVSYRGFGVTIEPKGGSPQPTGERVLGGKL
jgi:anti-sigma-K factor RskA